MPGDEREGRIGRYIVDLVRGSLLIEIQTGSFGNIRAKLAALAKERRVRLVYPIAKCKWIVRVSSAGKVLDRKPSPRRGRLVDLFGELVSAPNLIGKANLTLDVLMIEEEELRRDDGKGSRHRKGQSIVDRRLVRVIDRIEFHERRDFMRFLPASLGKTFTNRDLAKAAGLRSYEAGRVTYCLRKMGLIRRFGYQERAYLFMRAQEGKR